MVTIGKEVEIFKLFRMMVCCQLMLKELLTAFGIHTMPHSINFMGWKVKTDKVLNHIT